MDVAEIRRVGRGVEAYPAEVSDCVGRCDTACVQRQRNGNWCKLTTVWSVFTSATRSDGFIHCWTAICFFQRVGRMTGSVGSEWAFPKTLRIVPIRRSRRRGFDVHFATVFACQIGPLMSITAGAMPF